MFHIPDYSTFSWLAATAAVLVGDGFAMRHYFWRFDKTNLIHLLIGALAGIVLGWFFFGYFSNSDRILKLGIGILALTIVLFQLFRAMIVGSATHRTPLPRQGIFWGTVSGFTSTLARIRIITAAKGYPFAMSFCTTQDFIMNSGKGYPFAMASSRSSSASSQGL